MEESRFTPDRPLTKTEINHLESAIKDVHKAYKSILSSEGDMMKQGSMEIARRIAAARGMLDEVSGFLQTGERGRRYTL